MAFQIHTEKSIVFLDLTMRPHLGDVEARHHLDVGAGAEEGYLRLGAAEQREAPEQRQQRRQRRDAHLQAEGSRHLRATTT